jgi:sulfonate transport system permease protein
MAIVDLAPPGDVGVAPGPSLVEAATVARSHRERATLPRPARRAIGPVAVVVLWHGLSVTGVLDERTLAAPLDVLAAGRDLTASGELPHHLLTSLQRVGLGLGFGVSVGLALALVTGFSRLIDDLVDPVVQVARSIPVLGLLPLVILWFGIGEEPKVLLVAVGTAFPIYVNTHAAIRGVDDKLVEAGTVFGLGRLGLVRDVVLPGALPGFLVGLRFAVTGAWLIMIIAEQINAREGIGYLMNEARAWYRTDIIVVGLVVYAGLGLATDVIIRALERRLLAWRRGFTGT